MHITIHIDQMIRKKFKQVKKKFQVNLNMENNDKTLTYDT